MKHEMNLLPLDPPKKKRSKIPKRKSSVFMVGAILLLLIIFAILFFLDWSCQNEIKKVEENINSKSEYQVIYTNLTFQNEVLKDRLQIQESINRDKDQPLKALAHIHKAIPDGLMVLNYLFRDEMMTISGETRNKETILEFKEKLTALDFFKAINMVNTSKKQQTTGENKNQINEEIWQFTFELEMNEV